MWMRVLEDQRRWQRENQSLGERWRQREREGLEVAAKADISEGVRKDRMQSWTSSGKSEKGVEELGFAMVGTWIGFSLFLDLDWILVWGLEMCVCV